MESNEQEAPDTLRRLETNDPSLITLTIGKSYGYDVDYIPRDGEWESAGKIIGKHTYLKEITLFQGCKLLGINNEDLKKFFHGLALNRSLKRFDIKQFNIDGEIMHSGEIFVELFPFFRNNKAFECLEIYGGNLGSSGFNLLAAAICQCTSLREFTFMGPPNSSVLIGDDESTAEAIGALARQPLLEQLHLRGIKIGKKASIALAALLRNPKCKLVYLGLPELDNEGTIMLAQALNENSSLKTLRLGSIKNVTEVGWVPVFTLLQLPACRLEEFSLHGCTDAALINLSGALGRNGTLRSLGLGNNPGISIEAWQSLFRYLQSPNCMLEDLSLQHYSGIINQTAIFLAGALANNNRLRVLNLCDNSMNDTGCQAFIPVLQNRYSALEWFDLRGPSVWHNFGILDICVGQQQKVEKAVL